MSDVEWDAEEFDADNFGKEAAAAPAVKDCWDGEDEPDQIKDKWDEENAGDDNAGTSEVVKKKKKSLKEIIAEKEAKKKEEMEKRRQQEEEAKRKLTPEEMLSEKLRQQRLQEDADLEVAKDAFGLEHVEGNDTAIQRKLDAFEPVTKEDFEEFGRSLKDKLVESERSTFYVGFLETLFRDVAANLEIDDVKRLSSSMNAIYNEKTKAQKGLKGKKKAKGKANLNLGKEDNYDDYQPATYEYDDFM